MGRNSVFEQVAYLPLLHKLVEESAGERFRQKNFRALNL